MKVKFCRDDISILINGLYQTRKNYGPNQETTIEETILRLIEVCETMKPRKKAKLVFKLEEIRLIRRCLIDWRNGFLVKGETGAADGVEDILLKLG